jgi:hypothetical protein
MYTPPLIIVFVNCAYSSVWDKTLVKGGQDLRCMYTPPLIIVFFNCAYSSVWDKTLVKGGQKLSLAEFS